jgi:hypothetical protein
MQSKNSIRHFPILEVVKVSEKKKGPLPTNPFHKLCPTCQSNLFLWEYAIKSKWVCFGCFSCWELAIDNQDLYYYKFKIPRIKIDNKENIEAVKDVSSMVKGFQDLLEAKINKNTCSVSHDVFHFMVAISILLKMAAEKAEALLKKYT